MQTVNLHLCSSHHARRALTEQWYNTEKSCPHTYTQWTTKREKKQQQGGQTQRQMRRLCTKFVAERQRVTKYFFKKKRSWEIKRDASTSTAPPSLSTFSSSFQKSRSAKPEWRQAQRNEGKDEEVVTGEKRNTDRYTTTKIRKCKCRVHTSTHTQHSSTQHSW